jgi:hypothetical protein
MAAAKNECARCERPCGDPGAPAMYQAPASEDGAHG